MAAEGPATGHSPRCGVRVVFEDDTVVFLPGALEISPMLASLESLFDEASFLVPSSSGLTKTGLLALQVFIETGDLPCQEWPSRAALEFVRAASFFDVHTAVEASAARMASRLLECEDEVAVVRRWAEAKEATLRSLEATKMDVDEVQNLVEQCPTLGLRGLSFAKLAVSDPLLQLFSLDFLRMVVLKAEKEAAEAVEILELQRELCRPGRGSTRRKKAALEAVASAQNRGSSTVATLVLALSQDQEAEVRKTALEVLAQLVPNDPHFRDFRSDSISVAVRLLSDASAQVRRAAVSALLGWSPLEERVCENLEKIVKQKPGKIKSAALQAMAKSLQDMSLARTQLLLSCLEDSDEQVQGAAADALASYAEHVAKDGVEAIADDISQKLICSRRHWVKRAASMSLPKILKLLDRPHPKAKDAFLFLKKSFLRPLTVVLF